MKAKELINYLENIIPLYIQEEYDNSGLIIGNENEYISKALITLDCTEEVIDEAIENNCNIIIAHHPILFNGIKKITGSNYTEKVIFKAIKNNISIYAIHTNLDNYFFGVNKKICDKLKIQNCEILAPKDSLFYKLIIYCPSINAEKIRTIICENGAGYVGNYSFCTFSTTGIGSFKGNQNSKPYVGKKEKIHKEKETKIEVIIPANLKNKMTSIIIKEHPYEEPAFDFIPLKNNNLKIGSGMIGELDEEMEVYDFLNFIKKVMKAKCIRHTKIIKKKIKKIAVCGGSGRFLLEKAINKNADIFISSDFKYHDFFDANDKIIVADIGHYESEQYTKELIKDILKEKFPKFATHLSQTNTNPINYL